MSKTNIEQLQAEFRELLENARNAMQQYDVSGALVANARIGEFFNKHFPSGINFQELFFTPEDKLKGEAKEHREMYNQLISGVDVGLTNASATLRGFIMDNVTSITQKQQTDKALGKSVPQASETIMSDMMRGIWVLSDVTDKQQRVPTLSSESSSNLDAKGKFVKQLIEKITTLKESIDKIWDNPNVTDKKLATLQLRTALEQYQASFQALVEHTVTNDVMPTMARSKLLEKVAHETREEAKRLPEGEKSVQLDNANKIQQDATQNRRKAVSFGKDSPLPVIGRRLSQEGEEHTVSSPRPNHHINR